MDHAAATCPYPRPPVHHMALLQIERDESNSQLAYKIIAANILEDGTNMNGDN